MYNTGERSEPEKKRLKITFRPPLLPIKYPQKTPPLTNLRGGSGPPVPPLDPRILTTTPPLLPGGNEVKSGKIHYIHLFDGDVTIEFTVMSRWLSPRNSVGGDIVTLPFVGGWVSVCVCASVRACVRHTLPCGHDSDYSFCPITFKLHM